ncbi:Transducin (alpha subunit), insertion [Glarea lozoyensis ATCC 20868]|uniref:Transducin (Alpha subunit), insertion n=1 Tax=Glarea lozoyensis (strain ATCC 20868 / MF5171) TaxID=1116229 RepID=S3DQ96_GLAL2|nr:Transducin (alpha subunit), insertion [Glarea lozoyensis ATCC 20868]EPE34221.1 Transducin (alpha subunit), insertion [Glarea lozoyensis ATCC 20868]
MDPVSAIGLAASLVSVGDVLARSLQCLINLQSRYRSASLIVSLLIGQLTTLKAAVNQITDWVTTSLFNDPKHEQVVADLEISLESCKILILVLEERLSQLERDGGGNLNVKGKIGFLWDESELKEFSNHLSNQANALNLLLTALHCRTTFERNALLQDNESRRIIKRIEENRASLLSLRDSTSEDTRRSKSTDNSHLLDTEFDFDQEVITTSVYRAALRSNLRKAARKGKSPGLPSETLGGFDPIPEIVESPGVFSGNLQESLSGPSGNDASLQSPQELSGYKRWFQTDEAITHTTEVDQVSTRLSRLSRLSDDVSVLSSETQERDDEGGPGQSLLASQNTVQEKPLEPNNRKWRAKKYRIRNIFTPQSSVDMQKLPAPLVLDPLVSVDGELPKVLVLGTGNSGKSTLCKSMDALCKGGWTIQDRLRFQEAVFTNTIQNMKIILKAMTTLDIPLDSDKNRSHALTIIHHPSSIGRDFPPDACNAIEALWEDGGVKQTFERSNEYILQDATAYFFNSLRRISEPEYIPTDEDIIMARIRSTGLYPMILSSGGISFKLIDTGGERSERKKWIHAFENVSIVIFTIDISAYDLVLYEDLNCSRLAEDIALFESISNSHWFSNTQFILLFTKLDILEAKLGKVSIKTYCPDFPGREDSLEDVKWYMEDRLLALIKDSKRIVTTIFTSFSGGYEGPANLVLDAIINQL